MDSLKALLAKKKAEKQDLVGDKKSVRRGEIEEARLKRLREEEEAERLEKEKRRKRLQGGSGGATEGGSGADAGGGPAGDGDAKAAAAAAQAEADAAALKALSALPRAEIFRRLRALKQPVTLFGEDDGDRVMRLARVQRDAALVDDEARYGGQQENTLLAIQREAKLKRKGGGGDDDGGGVDPGAKGGKPPGSGKGGEAGGGGGAKGEAAPGPSAPAEDGGAAGGPSSGGAGGALEDAFAAAARRLAEQRAEEAMSVEDRIYKYLWRWCQEWGDDLEARSDEAKISGPGHQATMVYKQSMRFMEPLWRQLKSKTLEDELKVGLWMMVQAMAQRNYLAANDVYLKLAIGNSPWPIGVTSVGIHERSAREKISHVMNSSGRAHIMNDEATRKYFQAIKRLMSNLQRLYPTDPSRSIDFNLVSGEGRGVAGGGSQKMALLEAEQRGEDWRQLGLPAAPHHMAPDGSVAIPAKWDNVLARAMAAAGVAPGGSSGDEEEEERGGGGGAGSARPAAPGSRPVTPSEPVR